MCLRLRKTARRGRSVIRSMWRRIRSWRLCRAALRLATVVIVSNLGRSSSLLAADLAGLAGLAADPLAGVLDALALVRLGLAGGPDLGGHLADQLLVDAHDRHPRRALHLPPHPPP